MADTVHVGDNNTTFSVIFTSSGSPVDLTGATVYRIYFRKPDNTLLTKTATLSATPTDGTISANLGSSDLDQAGQWILQGYVSIPARSFYSDAGYFTVLENITD